MGFFLRSFLIFSLPYPSYPEKIDDAHQYDIMALNILQGHGFSQKESAPFEPTICRTPIYPFFLASVFGVFGHSYTAVYIIQALMSTLTALLVYIIALKGSSENPLPYSLSLDGGGSLRVGVKKKQVASLAYLLAILCPFLWFSARMLYTEIFITFLVALLILLIVYTLEKGKLWLYFISGIMMGVTLLTRPALAPFPFILSLLIILSEKNRDNFLNLFSKTLIYLAAVLLVWSPWIIRNYVVFKKIIPLSVASGSYLYLGTFPPNRYEKDFPMDMKEWETYLFKEGNEILALDEEYRKKGIERIKEKPLTYLKYSIQRVPLLWFSSFSHYFNVDVSASELKNQIKEKFYRGQYLNKELAIMSFKITLSFINLFYVLTGVL